MDVFSARKAPLKFKNKRTADGYASKIEATVGAILELKQKAGEIKDLKRQPQVFLTAAQITYRPDFKYTDSKTNIDVYVEVKGVETERWRVIKKLWTRYGPGDLEIWKGTHKYPKLVETLTSTPVHCPQCGWTDGERLP